MQAIYTQTASGSGTAITFNNIPQTYTDLMVVCSFRSSTAATGTDNFVTLNGDNSSANNYNTTRLYGQGSAASSDRQTANIFRAGDVPAANSTASVFGNQEIYIPNYTGNIYKQIITMSSQESNATTPYYNMAQSTVYRSNLPITSITAGVSTGNLVAASTMTLYGISR